MRRFARRRPGTFLVGAAVAGALVGRLTRGVVAQQKEESSPNGRAGAPQPHAGPAATPPVPQQGDQQGDRPGLPQPGHAAPGGYTAPRPGEGIPTPGGYSAPQPPDALPQPSPRYSAPGQVP